MTSKLPRTQNIKKLRINMQKKPSDVRVANIIASIFSSEATKKQFLSDPKLFLKIIDIDPSEIYLSSLVKVVKDLSANVVTLDKQGVDVLKESCSFEYSSEAGSKVNFDPDVRDQQRSHREIGCQYDFSNGKLSFDEMLGRWITKTDLMPLITPTMISKISKINFR